MGSWENPLKLNFPVLPGFFESTLFKGFSHSLFCVYGTVDFPLEACCSKKEKHFGIGTNRKNK